ncbi:MAG: GNAT family N-acetyltransferase [Acetobacteraceae bacterium]|nr:GNAT family N-acetyltransferase [Acetobacteraceae bacterium]
MSGGFWGCTLFGWLSIQMLVVPPALRGSGIGTALMLTAEAEARARGCRGAYVDTFSFQAPGFYRKLGYREFGVLRDLPPGYEQVFFCKRLDAVVGRAEPLMSGRARLTFAQLGPRQSLGHPASVTVERVGAGQRIGATSDPGGRTAVALQAPDGDQVVDHERDCDQQRHQRKNPYWMHLVSPPWQWDD